MLRKPLLAFLSMDLSSLEGGIAGVVTWALEEEEDEEAEEEELL